MPGKYLQQKVEMALAIVWVLCPSMDPISLKILFSESFTVDSVFPLSMRNS